MVVHSKSLFLTISFAFPCRPLGALVRFPCGEKKGTLTAMQASVSPMFRKKSKAHVRERGGGGLKI